MTQNPVLHNEEDNKGKCQESWLAGRSRY